MHNQTQANALQSTPPKNKTSSLSHNFDKNHRRSANLAGLPSKFKRSIFPQTSECQKLFWHNVTRNFFCCDFT